MQRNWTTRRRRMWSRARRRIKWTRRHKVGWNVVDNERLSFLFSSLCCSLVRTGSFHTHTHTLRELNNAWLRFLPYHISMNSSNRMWSKLANFDRAPNRIDFFGCCWSHTLLILLFALVLFCLTRFSSVNFSPGFLFRVDTTKKRCLNSNKCKIYNIQRFEIAMNSKESIFPGCEFNFNFISIELEFNHCNVTQFIRVFFLTSVHTTQRLRFNLISETKRKNRNNCHS